MGKRALIVIAAIAALSVCACSSAASSSFYAYPAVNPQANQGTCTTFADGESAVAVENWSVGAGGVGDTYGLASSQLQTLTEAWVHARYHGTNADIRTDVNAIAAWCNAHGYHVVVPPNEEA
jgi:hypothetical protein